MGLYKYKAFISYSHKDRAWASWLHNRLENYRFPKNIVGRELDTGIVPANLKPIFRDREDLAAGSDLGVKIEAALRASENLIVICSPNANGSHWVNEEVLYFKRHNRGANIFAIVVDGEPFAKDKNVHLECFPQGLRFQMDRTGVLTDKPAEPLAADLRNNADGKRLGFLKLISGMVGLGLDDLVQRDLVRARKRVTAVTLSAITAVLAMGSLTWLAVDARKEAEQRRGEAEGLVEFMLTDLRDKLEPVSRLDVLDTVGTKAAEYYGNYDEKDLDADSLGRRSEVFHFLGSIQDKLGDDEEARSYFQSAYDATKALLKADKDNPERVFEHAQSSYWVGYAFWQSGSHKEALPFFEKYLALAQSLTKLQPEQARSLQEISYANEMVGIMTYFIGDVDGARDHFETAVRGYEQNKDLFPNNLQYQRDYINGILWLAVPYEHLGKYKKSLNLNEKACELYMALLDENPQDQVILHELFNCENDLLIASFLRGNINKAAELIGNVEKRLKELLSTDPANTENLIYEVYNVLDQAKISLLKGDVDTAKKELNRASLLYKNELLTTYDSVFVTHYLPREYYLISISYFIQTGQRNEAKETLVKLKGLIDGFGVFEDFELEEKRSYIQFSLYDALLSDSPKKVERLIARTSQMRATTITLQHRRDLMALAQKYGIELQLDLSRELPGLDGAGSLFQVSMKKLRD